MKTDMTNLGNTAGTESNYTIHTWCNTATEVIWYTATATDGVITGRTINTFGWNNFTIPNITEPSMTDKFEELKNWTAEKMCEMIGKREEAEYEMQELRERIEALELTLKLLVDALVKKYEGR